jgi:hypothetical protein
VTPFLRAVVRHARAVVAAGEGGQAVLAAHESRAPGANPEALGYVCAVAFRCPAAGALLRELEASGASARAAVSLLLDARLGGAAPPPPRGGLFVVSRCGGVRARPELAALLASADAERARQDREALLDLTILVEDRRRAREYKQTVHVAEEDMRRFFEELDAEGQA